jgi:hypothetical protein
MDRSQYLHRITHIWLAVMIFALLAACTTSAPSYDSGGGPALVCTPASLFDHSGVGGLPLGWPGSGPAWSRCPSTPVGVRSAGVLASRGICETSS